MMQLSERLAVLKTYGGILPYYEVFYLAFIKSHIEKSVEGFRNFYTLAILEKQETALMELAEAIRHAGIVGKYFHSVKNKPQHKIRAQKLRLSFGIADDSPLLDFRLRNSLEHLDERLDDYFLEGTMGQILPFCLTDEDFTEFDFQSGHVFLAANPNTAKIYVLNQEFEFGPLMQELYRLSPLAEAAYDDGGRLPNYGNL